MDKYLAERIDLSDEQFELIFSLFKLRKVERNEILFSKGQICKHFYFVNKGCIRMFYIEPDGAEITRYFAFEKNFGTALSSFITQKPSREYIQAVEKSEVLSILRNDFYQILETIPFFEKIYRRILETSHDYNSQRIESLLGKNAKERYVELTEQSPGIIKRIPNKLIASYLGISAETLSRIKRQVLFS
ncbi:MAG: Crp/Fnr family transcriptional regulator [Bacteroidota bacterium]|nr:Crp/Fnr family transcriptional regulator [Bacteroidota bacterium]